MDANSSVVNLQAEDIPPDMRLFCNATTEQLFNWSSPNCTWPEFPMVMTSEEMFYYYLWTFVTPCLFGIIFLVGTVGNLLVIYVILSRPAMRTVTNYLLLNLAFADISFLWVVIPTTAYKYIASGWPFGDIMCKVVNYFVYVTAYITIYTLVAISALRFLTVVYGVSTAKWRTRRNISILILFIWVLMLAINIPAMLVHKVKHVFQYSYCGVENYAVGPLFITFFVFSYIWPLILICCLYLLIMNHLHAHSVATIDNTHAKDRTSKVYRVLFLVVLVFCISWLPLHVNSLIAKYGTLPKGAFYEVFRILWNCMAYGNSCVNPLIYNYASQEFRKSFREVFNCKRPLRRRQTQTGTGTEMSHMITTTNGKV